ncbi:hypothetical protein K431DRAFT_294210 [Polychaeton citri CBS 116435]|uniref:Uncharacterized protein n=1 Tax=Polychaeton citri CBS 116435 TaxID=1314669 RepID=A0A9P4UPC1_9PEZI|nr:hypothetical protein K431DRAFT_294210 [Polychaeton citri CBS 116435]
MTPWQKRETQGRPPCDCSILSAGDDDVSATWDAATLPRARRDDTRMGTGQHCAGMGQHSTWTSSRQAAGETGVNGRLRSYRMESRVRALEEVDDASASHPALLSNPRAPSNTANVDTLGWPEDASEPYLTSPRLPPCPCRLLHLPNPSPSLWLGSSPHYWPFCAGSPRSSSCNRSTIKFEAFQRPCARFALPVKVASLPSCRVTVFLSFQTSRRVPLRPCPVVRRLYGARPCQDQPQLTAYNMLALAASSSAASPPTEAPGQDRDDAASTAGMHPLDLIRAVDGARSAQQYPSSSPLDIGNLPIEVDEMEDDAVPTLDTLQPSSFLANPDASHSERMAFFAGRAQTLLQRHGLSATLSIHERLDPVRPNGVSKARKPQKPKMVLRCRECGKARRGHAGICPDCKKGEGQPHPPAGSSSSAREQVGVEEDIHGEEQDVQTEHALQDSTSEPHQQSPQQATQVSMLLHTRTIKQQGDDAGFVPCPQDVPHPVGLLTVARAASTDEPDTSSLAGSDIAGIEVDTPDSCGLVLGGAFIPRPSRNPPRVHREIRVRVRYRCEHCQTTFAADDTCRECGHRRCASCVSDL